MERTMPEASPSITARAGRYYRNARYIISVLFIAFGVWCINDGFVTWPEHNRADLVKALKMDAAEVARLPHSQILAMAEQRSVTLRHPGLDVPFNQILGIALPAAAMLVLAWAICRSRGVYRLENGVLHIPSHPPIPLDAIRKIDKRLWDRKGIAVIEYALPNASPATFKLDDFIYERDPIDAILDQIEAHVQQRSGL